MAVGVVVVGVLVVVRGEVWSSVKNVVVSCV